LESFLVMARTKKKAHGGKKSKATRNDVMQVGEASNAIQQPQQPTKVHLVSSLNAPLCKGIGKP
jgi:hypothetical protein